MNKTDFCQLSSGARCQKGEVFKCAWPLEEITEIFIPPCTILHLLGNGVEEIL
ncbi:rCG60262 [Rattus norvegicus]|uniref:RCG60262 n=1 Tax=Rattus norvegicus TaxID=10116 RepID=A6HRD3_RAT|nr:rCG60262 [Rattus norvegicus]